MKNAFKIVALVLTIMSMVQAFASNGSKGKGTNPDIKITIRGHGPTI